MTQQATTTDELTFIRPYGEQEKQVLTAEAVEFLTELVTHFTPQRNKLLAARIQQQQDIDNGTLPDFISETTSIRESNWKIRGIPADLQDRRVEITGPVERKMVINALNANVKVFMADFEDSLAPDWNKVIDGQINLRDAVNGTISYTNEAGKIYQLKPNPAVLICRVRGLHLPEKHVTWRGEAIPGSLFDFALYFFHNYQALLAKGSGPYFICQKLSPGRKLHGGAKSSLTQKVALTCRAAPSRQRYSLKPCLLYSRWMKSFTHCATILSV